METSTPDVDREIPVQGGLSSQAVRGLAEFIKIHYLDRRVGVAGQAFQESWSETGDTVELSWPVLPPGYRAQAATQEYETTARLSIGPGGVYISFQGLRADDVEGGKRCRRAADDIEVLVNSFLTNAKMTTLYFVFSTGASQATRDVPGSSGAMGRDTMKTIFAGNMLNLYLLIMAASFVLFFLLGDNAIFAVLGLQLLTLFFSDRLALGLGKVRPTEDRPKVTIVSVPVSPETREIARRFAKEVVPETREKLETVLSAEGQDDSRTRVAVQEVMAQSGFKSDPRDVKLVTRDVYGLVKGVADRFKLPVPKIVIMNNPADNAAATGVSPRRASITITAGSLEDLDDPELSSVVGHEMGHIKGRDSLILFSVTFVLFVGGLYLWFPLLLYLGNLIILYYIFVFAIIYGVGKVLETRADTESVVKLGQPGVLASALTNIGFRQLYYERYSPGSKLVDWLKFDPHPPIYFRIQRLSRFAKLGSKIDHTSLISLRDCVSGFIRALVEG